MVGLEAFVVVGEVGGVVGGAGATVVGPATVGREVAGVSNPEVGGAVEAHAETTAAATTAIALERKPERM